MPNVISHVPQIFKISDVESKIKKLNYLILASDGVYECFGNNEELSLLINTVLCENVHEFLGKNSLKAKHIIAAKVVDKILTTCLLKNCSDNISVIIIFFNISKELIYDYGEKYLNNDSSDEDVDYNEKNNSSSN